MQKHPSRGASSVLSSHRKTMNDVLVWREPKKSPNIAEHSNKYLNFECVLEFYQSYTTDISTCGNNEGADLVSSNIGPVIVRMRDELA